MFFKKIKKELVSIKESIHKLDYEVYKNKRMLQKMCKHDNFFFHECIAGGLYKKECTLCGKLFDAGNNEIDFLIQKENYEKGERYLKYKELKKEFENKK